MRTKRNDGGKSTSKFPKEINDCSVVATSIAFSLDYDFVHAVFCACGRKYGWGVAIDLLAHALALCGEFVDMKANRLIITTIPVVSFTEEYSTGTYLIFCKENWQPYWHICTCINGTIHDNLPGNLKEHFLNKAVIAVWHIT